MKLLQLAWILIAAISLHTKAWAFKVETHVWVAQQIINDLSTCSMPSSPYCVSIKKGSEIVKVPVKEDIARAILDNQATYRLGNIGPDAFPDILVGQTEIHPGGKDYVNGWGTGHWIQHLMSQAKTAQETAFVYGFISHAASDTFAHTYVNAYSGDIFDLQDHDLTVEKRHIILESYIKEKNPPIADSNGKVLGRAEELVQINGKLASPNDFLSREIYFNPAANKNLSSAHILTILGLRKHVEKLLNGSELSDLEDAIQKYVLQCIFETEVSQKDVDQLNKWFGELSKYQNSETDKILKAKDQVNKAVKESMDHIGKVADKAIDALITQRVEEIRSLNKKALDYKSKADDLGLKLAQLPQTIIEDGCSACGRLPGGAFGVPGPKEIRKKTCKVVSKVNPALEEVRNQIKEADNLHDEALKQIVNASEDLKANILTSIEIAKKTIDAEAAIMRSIIELLQRTSSSRPIHAMLEGWSQDIDKAMVEWVNANGEAIINSMRPEPPVLATTPRETIMKPLSDWLECSGASIFALPSFASEAACTAKDYVIEIKLLVDDMMRKTAPRPFQKLIEFKANWVDKQLDWTTDQSIQLFIRYINEDVGQLIDVAKERGDDENLRKTYMLDTSSKSLLLIDDIAARVRAEMHITAEGTFDPEKFAVVYNAVQLSKLSLLDDKALNSFAAEMGVDMVSLNNKQLYDDTAFGRNIIAGAVRSIDGNHQWMPLAPEYARTEGVLDALWDYSNPDPTLQTGKSGQEGRRRYELVKGIHNDAAGFRIFDNESARIHIFNVIFKGPMSPGTENPESIGMQPIPGSDLQRLSCPENKFPKSNDDKTCRFIYVVDSVFKDTF